MQQLVALNRSHLQLQAPKEIVAVRNSKHTAQFVNVTVQERWNEVMVFGKDWKGITLERFARNVDELVAKRNPNSAELRKMIEDIEQVRNDVWKSYYDAFSSRPFGDSEKFLNDKIGKLFRPAQDELERKLHASLYKAA